MQYNKRKPKMYDGGFLNPNIYNPRIAPDLSGSVASPNLSISGVQTGTPAPKPQVSGALIGTGTELITGLMGNLGASKGVTNVVGGVGKGVAAGAALGPVGMIAGGALGLVTSLLGNKAEKKAQAAQDAQTAIYNNQETSNITRQALAGYNQDGNTTSYYKMGGNIKPSYLKIKTGGIPEAEYEVEKGEVVQGEPNLEHSTELSSDMHLVGGERHEDGGTDGTGGERVFSDRTKLGKTTTEALKTLGIKLLPSNTYADAAAKIGRKKGIAEKKIDSKINPSKRTGQRMLEDHDNALDILFDIQEMNKMKQRRTNYYATGGPIKPSQSYPPVPKDLVWTNIDYTTKGGNIIKQSDLDAYKKAGLDFGNNPRLLGDYIDSMNTQPTKSTTVIPTGREDMVYENTGVQGQQIGGRKYASGGVIDFINKNEGQLINGTSYLANLASINKLDTTVRRNYLRAPRYNYVNRSQPAINANREALQIGTNALTSSSQGVNASNAGAMFAKTLDANSIIANQENMRRDAYDENYNQRADNVNYNNTMLNNDAMEQERIMQNEKRVALPMQARNAFLQGYAGNTAMTQRNNLDKQRMILSAYLNDQNGVLSRIKRGDLENMKNLPIFSMFN